MITSKTLVGCAVALTITLSGCAPVRHNVISSRTIVHNGMDIPIEERHYETNVGDGETPDWQSMGQRRYILVGSTEYLCNPEQTDEECLRMALRLYNEATGDDY